MTAPHTAALDTDALARQISLIVAGADTFGSLFGYEESDYEVLYALGHSLYSQARYQDAMRIFGFLVVNNQLEKRFFNAFASSLQMLQRHAEAIQYYSMASLLDIDDPLPTFHTAECFIALNCKAEAKEALKFVVEQSTAPSMAEVKTRAQSLLDLLGDVPPAAATH
ncbi:hypothetical protein SDC9_64584 [bioreactor metagenome]|uniref:CesD/SycD/LcrH family type III secretion system chaperone n=1 Tax=bioreactor metagenome TaxID=1076179 RepID=A0A644XQY0_9ZZZZ